MVSFHAVPRLPNPITNFRDKTENRECGKIISSFLACGSCETKRRKLWSIKLHQRHMV